MHSVSDPMANKIIRKNEAARPDDLAYGGTYITDSFTWQGGPNTTLKRRSGGLNEFFRLLVNASCWHSDGGIGDKTTMQDTEIKRDDIAFFYNFLRLIWYTMDNLIVYGHTKCRRKWALGALRSIS